MLTLYARLPRRLLQSHQDAMETSWEIALMVNGLKVSLNIKGNKLIISFIIAFFVSEIISKVLIYFIQ